MASPVAFLRSTVTSAEMATVYVGLRHRSKGDSSVLCSGPEKRYWVVWLACRQHGQVGAGNRPTRCLKVLSAEHYPERVCASVVLVPVGSSTSSVSASGAADPRNMIEPLLAKASRTAFVLIVYLGSLASSTQASTLILAL